MDDRCRKILERLSPYLDRELDEKESREVESHLELCTECRGTLEELRRNEEILAQSLQDEPIDPDREAEAMGRLIGRIDTEPRPSWEKTQRSEAKRSIRWRWRFGWAAGLAAVTAAVLLALRLGPFPLAPEKPISIPEKMNRGVKKVAQADRVEEQADDRRKPLEPLESTEPSVAHEAAEGDAGAGFGERPEAGVTSAEKSAEAEVDSRLRLTIRSGEGSHTTVDAPAPRTAVESDEGEKRGGDAAREIEAFTVTASPPPSKRGLHSGIVDFSPPDTFGSTAGWRARLIVAMRALSAQEPPELGDDERAARWRQIGDLWEWLGRSESDPGAYLQALEAYGRSLELDPSGKGLDTTRMERARRGSEGKETGNTRSGHR